MKRILFACALLLVSARAVHHASAADDFASGPILARGKGVEVRRGHLDDAFVAFRANLAARGQTLPEGRRDTAEAQLLDRMIVTQLLVQRATPADHTAAKTNAVRFFEESRRSIDSEEAFLRHLKSLGMTSAQFTNRVMDQALSEEVVKRELKDKAAVPDSLVRLFYETNSSAFTQPEMARASHILFATRDFQGGLPLSTEQRLAKKKAAEDMLVRARQGEDFATLAKSSDDPTVEYKFSRAADNPRMAMAPDFERAAFALKAGQISDVVTTDFGYHIIKLHEIIPSRKAPFAEVEERIRAHLTQQEMEKLMPPFFAKLKQEASVEILDEKLRIALEKANQAAEAR